MLTLIKWGPSFCIEAPQNLFSMEELSLNMRCQWICCWRYPGAGKNLKGDNGGYMVRHPRWRGELQHRNSFAAAASIYPAGAGNPTEQLSNRRVSFGLSPLAREWQSHVTPWRISTVCSQLAREPRYIASRSSGWPEMHLSACFGGNIIIWNQLTVVIWVSVNSK